MVCLKMRPEHLPRGRRCEYDITVFSVYTMYDVPIDFFKRRTDRASCLRRLCSRCALTYKHTYISSGGWVLLQAVCQTSHGTNECEALRFPVPFCVAQRICEGCSQVLFLQTVLNDTQVGQKVTCKLRALDCGVCVWIRKRMMLGHTKSWVI